MRKMQKIAALGLAGTMALSLAACGGSGDSTADTASTAESTASSTEATAESTGSGDEAVTLNWALWDKDSTAYWQALADGYMESHPNVTIEMTDLGSTDYMTQLATQLAGGNGELDVLSIKDIPGYSNLINLGMLEPLNGKLTTDESKFNGVLEQLTAQDGNYYAVPFRSDFWVVYYNKDIFDQAGVEYPTNDMTMADFDAKIREVNEKAGVYGNIYHTWRSATTLFGILDGQHTVIDGNYDFLKPYYEQVLSEQADGVIPNYGEQKTSGLDKIHHRVDQQQLRCEKRQNDDHHKRAAVLRLHDLCDRPRRGVRRNDADERDLARRKERFSHQPPERRGAEHTGDVAQRPARPWLSGKDVAVHKAEHEQHQKRQDRQTQQEDDARRRPQRARTKFGSLLFHFQLPPLF